MNVIYLPVQWQHVRQQVYTPPLCMLTENGVNVSLNKPVFKKVKTNKNVHVVVLASGGCSGGGGGVEYVVLGTMVFKRKFV